MKNIFIIIIIFSLLLPATKVSAFSFIDLLYFFDEKPQTEEISEIEKQETIFSRYSVEEKYKIWKIAYDNNDIRLASDNSDNLVFTEDEINYLIETRLGDMKYPPVNNIKLELEDGLIKAKGSCLKKFFNGDFELEIIPINQYGQVSFEVKKARFKGIFFPKFIASLILKGEMSETLDFLHSNPDFAKLILNISENQLKLEYSN